MRKRKIWKDSSKTGNNRGIRRAGLREGKKRGKRRRRREVNGWVSLAGSVHAPL